MTEETEKQEKHDEKKLGTENKHEEKHKAEKPAEKTRPSVAEFEKKLEREFIIPLRRKFKKTARYKRVPKSIRAIKEYLVRHMKLYGRDLSKIKIDKYLNEFVWARGIRNPPSKIKVRAIVDGDFIRAELAELTEALKFKKQKLERRETKTRPSEAELKKKESERPAEPSKTEGEKAEEKEKQAAVIEAGKKIEKATAKQAKHTTRDKTRQPKHQRRMALQK